METMVHVVEPAGAELKQGTTLGTLGRIMKDERRSTACFEG